MLDKLKCFIAVEDPEVILGGRDMRNPEDLKKEILGNENGLILEGSISGMFIRPNKKKVITDLTLICLKT
jgi:hypothetical protein